MATTDARFMIYGANGYTGTLAAEHAVARGHRPVLAGRSADKVRPLADRLGLPWLAIDLADRPALERALAGLDAVLHTAGPFVHTSAPMVDACLASKVSYLDVTGELPVFAATFARDRDARGAGICLMSGVGFDVVPTDCLARYVSDRTPGATELELAFAAIGSPSAGTAKSALEQARNGGLVRRDGRLVPYPVGKGAKRIRFTSAELWCVPVPWGDLETAYVTTHIPNITTYMAQPPRNIRAMRVGAPVLRMALAIAPVRRALARAIERRVHGPDEAARERGRSHIWARAATPDGRATEARLETAEGYLFTARSSIRAVERVLELRPSGALTPAGAFGADFVLEIEGSVRS